MRENSQSFGIVLALVLFWAAHLQHASALLVFTQCANQTKNFVRTFQHTTASFGAQQPYNVTAELTLAADNPSACERLDPNATRGKIVLVVRGGCLFIQKAQNAEWAGAAGIIVGDDNKDGTFPLKMINTDKDTRLEAEKDGKSSPMPVIFIEGKSYNELKDHLQGLQKKDKIMATLNRIEDVKYRKGDNTNPRQPLMPFLWLMLGLSYYTRRLMVHYVARRRRVPAVRGMPIVHYVPLDEDLEAAQNESLRISRPRRSGVQNSGVLDVHTEATTARQVINTACAVCFEDFKSGEQLKALPCRHGFHSACIDPWLLSHSDRCPICNHSILNPNVPGHSRVTSSQRGNNSTARTQVTLESNAGTGGNVSRALALTNLADSKNGTLHGSNESPPATNMSDESYETNSRDASGELHHRAMPSSLAHTNVSHSNRTMAPPFEFPSDHKNQGKQQPFSPRQRTGARATSVSRTGEWVTRAARGLATNVFGANRIDIGHREHAH